MNFLRRKSKVTDNAALSNYTGGNKLALQNALDHLLDRKITYQPRDNGRNTADAYQVTLKQDLIKQLAKEDPMRREARQNPRNKYGHINSPLEIHGLLTVGFFQQLVVEIANEVGISVEEALPVVWESVINEIKTDSDLIEGELIAQALERQMRDSYAFDERYRRAWDAAIETGDLNAMAEIMGSNFMKTDMSRETFSEGDANEGQELLGDGTNR